MTESIKDYNDIKRFGESVLCSLEDRSERITIDLHRVKKSTENVPDLWEGKRAVGKRANIKVFRRHSFFWKRKKKVLQEANNNLKVQSCNCEL